MLSNNPPILHQTVRRWNHRFNKTVGFQLEPKLFILFVGSIILLFQFVIYLMLSSQTIYCQIPNLRSYYLHNHRTSKSLSLYEKLPTIYVITPTYDRYVQKAELTRLSQTLMIVPNLHWIIVEDSDRRTELVSKFVARLENEFDFGEITLLHSKTPDRFKLKHGEPGWKQPKGVWQRNKALEWLRENSVDLDRDGVIYFADDDNTYDVEVFNEMRFTRKVSVWPVGLAGGLLVERPIVSDRDGNKIHSFNSMWESKRPFPLDMAGFAINLRLFMGRQEAKFSSEQRIGYMESNFLGQLVNSWDELEPKANKCTKVLVWHTKTQTPALHEERKLIKPSYSDIEW